MEVCSKGTLAKPNDWLQLGYKTITTRAKTLVVSSGRSGIRTLDQGIMSPLL